MEDSEDLEGIQAKEVYHVPVACIDFHKRRGAYFMNILVSGKGVGSWWAGLCLVQLECGSL